MSVYNPTKCDWMRIDSFFCLFVCFYSKEHCTLLHFLSLENVIVVMYISLNFIQRYNAWQNRSVKLLQVLWLKHMDKYSETMQQTQWDKSWILKIEGITPPIPNDHKALGCLAVLKVSKHIKTCAQSHHYSKVQASVAQPIQAQFRASL